METPRRRTPGGGFKRPRSIQQLSKGKSTVKKRQRRQSLADKYTGKGR